MTEVAEMKHQPDKKRKKKPRIKLTDEDLRHLSDIRGERSVPALVKQSGLPYMLVYNIVHGRVKTISDRHYRMLFSEVPPHRVPKKIDGAAFRAMVDLWLYLNDGASKSDLYREFYGDGHAKRPDYRIFTGQTHSVDYRLERIMREKFSAAGIGDSLLDQWIDEWEALGHEDRVPYRRVRPALIYIREKLGVHPTSLLNQSVNRYETGMLKRISRDVYDQVMRLKHETEAALGKGRPRDLEKLKETITGGKEGYTLYLDVREELQFLHQYARKSPKRYLGRGLWIYETGRAKRIPDGKARKIIADCERFIRETPDLPLAALPRSLRRKRIGWLLDVMVARAAQLLSNQEGIVLEKRILKPQHARDVYKMPYNGFTRFDRASSVLGMRRRAFDLMVAKNCEIFRSVGTYAKQWYLSDLYLKELSQNEFFDLISTKYELLAKRLGGTGRYDRCMI
jgi:hypothetical protein